jgi:hypothetical protein
MSDDDGEFPCPACEECGTYALTQEGGKFLARCQNCGHEIEMAIVRCCDLHGANCEPEEPCCRYCTEGRHCRWTDERGVQRHGHPEGEVCAAPDRALDEILASPEHKRVIREVLERRGIRE